MGKKRKRRYISASRRDMIGAALYLAGFEGGVRLIHEPCGICRRMIANAGIEQVITE